MTFSPTADRTHLLIVSDDDDLPSQVRSEKSRHSSHLETG